MPDCSLYGLANVKHGSEINYSHYLQYCIISSMYHYLMRGRPNSNKRQAQVRGQGGGMISHCFPALDNDVSELMKYNLHTFRLWASLKAK